jgi:hypothetical protein
MFFDIFDQMSAFIEYTPQVYLDLLVLPSNYTSLTLKTGLKKRCFDMHGGKTKKKIFKKLFCAFG